MANPLVKAGIKLAVKGGKKIAKKIKTRANSTDNMSSKGPIDKSIFPKGKSHYERILGKFGDKVNKELDIQDFKKNWDGSAQLAIKKRKLK